MIRLIMLIPFAIELPYDKLRWDKGKPDMPWQIRVLIVICLSAIAQFTRDYSMIHFDVLELLKASSNQTLKDYAMAAAPYCFFDPILAVCKMGWRKWHYLGEKRWDRALSNINHLALLVLRVLLFIGLLIYAL